MKRKALGRGLEALIPKSTKKPEGEATPKAEGIENIPISEIRQSRFQPRTVFSEEALKDLASSLQAKGFIQPIVVAKKPQGYELIAGERRWRAAKLIGLKEVPAIVRVVRDAEALEIALIENIQRENLNPIEEARAYERLMAENAFTQEELSKAVGKNRSSIANFLRLLKLPGKIQDDLADARLTMGHARALLALDTDHDRLSLRDQIIHSGMNVREVEASARKTRDGKKKKAARPADIFLEKVRLDLERKLAARVDIKGKANGGGSISVRYSSVDELNRIIELIG